MKTLTWLLTLAMAPGLTTTLTFDSASLGKMPPGWTARPAAGAPAAWKVVRDSSAPTHPFVFAHVPAEGASGPSPLAILREPECTDGEISVRFKPVAGSADQDAGLIWRYRGPRDYYFVRADARQKNVVMYRVQNGQTAALLPRGNAAGVYAVSRRVEPDSWQILKVVFKGSAFSVYSNHRRILRVDDTALAGPGKVGLWTKPDSITYFDNFRLVRKR